MPGDCGVDVRVQVGVVGVDEALVDEIAVMAKAGHASMTTTKRYLHLAGVVFRDEAERLERRLLGAAVESSTDLS